MMHNDAGFVVLCTKDLHSGNSKPSRNNYEKSSTPSTRVGCVRTTAEVGEVLPLHDSSYGTSNNHQPVSTVSLKLASRKQNNDEIGCQDWLSRSERGTYRYSNVTPQDQFLTAYNLRNRVHRNLCFWDGESRLLAVKINLFAFWWGRKISRGLISTIGSQCEPCSMSSNCWTEVIGTNSCPKLRQLYVQASPSHSPFL